MRVAIMKTDPVVVKFDPHYVATLENADGHRGLRLTA
jgi:hypothetical protein